MKPARRKIEKKLKFKMNLFKDNINNTNYTQNMSKVSKKSVIQEAKQVEKVIVVKEQVEPVNQQVAQPVVNAQPDVLDEKAIVRQAQYEELLKKLDQSQEELSSLKSNLKKFYKLVEKDVLKASKGRRRGNRERSPTGFGKAGTIPEGLRTLLKLDETTELTRPEVTKQLYAYLDAHELRDTDDKRIIRVNADLVKAFGLTAEQAKNINECTDIKGINGLNFYNIQKYVAALYNETNENQIEVETEQETEVEDVVQVKGRSKKANK